MSVYTPPTTIVTNDLIPAAQMNTDWVENIKFLADPPRCEMIRNTTQAITTATWTLITFNSEVQDTDTMFTVASGDRITVTTAGKYLFTFTAGFAADTSGTRRLAICTGTAAETGMRAQATVDADENLSLGLNCAVEISLAAAATVSFQVYQSSGGNLNTLGDVAGVVPRVTARWVAIS